jgi:hypothetical protein
MVELISLTYFLSVSSLVLLGLASLVLLFLFVVTSLKASREHGILPDSLPWVGKRKNQLFASVRANLRGATQSAKLFTEGYYKVFPPMLRLFSSLLTVRSYPNKYSKNEQIFVVPTWTKGPQVILPASMINWLAHQPKDLMNAKDCTFENMQFAYTVHHPEITHNDMLDLLIKRDLTRSIGGGSLNDEVVDELEASFSELFGRDMEGWRDVCVWDSMIRIVARTANRVFVGSELCENFSLSFLTSGDDLMMWNYRSE